MPLSTSCDAGWGSLHLQQLPRTYRGSEEWVREVVLRETPPKARAGVRDTTLVQDAAFALYAHGATDYRP